MSLCYEPFLEWATRLQLRVHLPGIGSNTLRCHWADSGLLALLIDAPGCASEWHIIIRRIEQEYERYRSDLQAVRHQWISGMHPFLWVYNKRPLWGVAYHMGSIPNLIFLSYKNEHPHLVLRDLIQYQDDARHYIALMHRIIERCKPVDLAFHTMTNTTEQTMVDRVFQYQLGCDSMMFALEPARCISGFVHLPWTYHKHSDFYACALIPYMHMRVREEGGDVIIRYSCIHSMENKDGFPLDDWHVHGLRISIADAGISDVLWSMAKERHDHELLHAFQWAWQYRNLNRVISELDYNEA